MIIKIKTLNIKIILNRKSIIQIHLRAFLPCTSPFVMVLVDKFPVGSLISGTNMQEGKTTMKTTVSSHTWQVNSKILTGDIANKASWIKKVHNLV